MSYGQRYTWLRKIDSPQFNRGVCSCKCQQHGLRDPGELPDSFGIILLAAISTTALAIHTHISVYAEDQSLVRAFTASDLTIA